MEDTLRDALPSGDRRFNRTTVAIGAPNSDLIRDSNGNVVLDTSNPDADTGASYVFDRSVDSNGVVQWNIVGEALLPCDPGRQLRMGWSVCLDSELLVVGARERQAPALANAHVFRKTGSAWLLESALEGGAGVLGDPGFFGWDVGVSAGRVAVTDPRFDTSGNGATEDAGVLYQFLLDFESDPPCGCRTDLNADGVTDISDVAILMAAWGPCPACTSDMSGDGEVDIEDLQMLFDAYGPCDAKGSVDPPQSLTDCLTKFQECPDLCTCIDAVLQLGNGS